MVVAMDGFRGCTVHKIIGTILAIAFITVLGVLAVAVLEEWYAWAKDAINDEEASSSNTYTTRTEISTTTWWSIYDEGPPFMILSE